MAETLHVRIPPDRIEPHTAIWRGARSLYRVHPAHYEPGQFNAGGGRPGRFHRIRDVGHALIPTLYAADRIDGALAETGEARVAFVAKRHGFAALPARCGAAKMASWSRRSHSIPTGS